MKTGDWLKLSLFALVGVVISLVILGFNSANNKKKALQEAYGNYPMEMQGYSNVNYNPQEKAARQRQMPDRNGNPGAMQMPGGNAYAFNGTAGEYSQTNYLPSQLAAMNYQMMNNDLYLQKEIAAIKQHDAKLHDEVQELQTQYGELRQGLNTVYATLNLPGNRSTTQNANTFNPVMSSNGMQMMNGGMGYSTPNQYQQTSMGGMGNMSSMQNPAMGYNAPAQYQQANGMNGMGYTTPNQYQQSGMGGMNNMSSMQNPAMGYNAPVQYQQAGGMNGMGMGMGNMAPMQTPNGMGYTTQYPYQQPAMGNMNSMQNPAGMSGMGGMSSMQNSSGMGMGMMDNMMMNNMMGMMNSMMGMMNNMGGMQGSSNSSGGSGSMSSGGGMSMM